MLAIGSPFQLNQTVTLGIVSAVGRTGVGVADYEDFIQTDAAINPGNSGGGLIDARGEVVGINTAIYSESGGYQGVGFAVPSNLARRIADDLINYGEVRRGSIGAMRLVTLTPELATQLEVQGSRGVLVYEMSRASSAFRAGIRPGDVIVAFNGQAVTEDSQVQETNRRREDWQHRHARRAAGGPEDAAARADHCPNRRADPMMRAQRGPVREAGRVAEWLHR